MLDGISSESNNVINNNNKNNRGEYLLSASPFEWNDDRDASEIVLETPHRNEWMDLAVPTSNGVISIMYI